MPNEKSQPDINNKMDIKEGIGKQAIKFKYVYEKQNDYGTNHFVQVLEESQSNT